MLFAILVWLAGWFVWVCGWIDLGVGLWLVGFGLRCLCLAGCLVGCVLLYGLVVISAWLVFAGVGGVAFCFGVMV